MPPGADAFVVRVYRDEAYIKELNQKINAFLDIMAERLEMIRSKSA